MKKERKKQYPEKLHDIFVKFGYCKSNQVLPIETTVELLIDEILTEERERMEKGKAQIG
jgi:transcriptional regulator of met regulon